MRQGGHLYHILRDIVYLYILYPIPLHKASLSQISAEPYTRSCRWMIRHNKSNIRGRGRGNGLLLKHCSFIYCLVFWSMTVILPRNRKAISGSGSSMRKEMGQDCVGTWEDCRDDGKHCRTGQSQELDCSAYAAGGRGEHTAKAFYWEVTLACSAAPSTAAGPCWTRCPRQKLRGWLKT